MGKKAKKKKNTNKQNDKNLSKVITPDLKNILIMIFGMNTKLNSFKKYSQIIKLLRLLNLFRLLRWLGCRGHSKKELGKKVINPQPYMQAEDAIIMVFGKHM